MTRARRTWLLLGLLRCAEDRPFPTSVDRACATLAAGVHCTPTAVLRCAPNGVVQSRLPPCAADERCYEGYGCGACAPGEVDCGADGETPRACETDHRWQAQPRCDVTQVCELGRCIAACDPDPAARETRGCEFWATQTLHRALARDQRSATPFSVVTANPWRRAAQFTSEGAGVVSSVRVLAARGIYTAEQPWNPALVEGGDDARPRSALVRGAAVRVRSGLRVAAWQFSPLAAQRPAPCEGASCVVATVDGSTLLPTTALGRFYVVAALPTARSRVAGGAWRAAPGFVSIVGTAASTRVTVLLRGATEGSTDGAVTASRAGDRREFTLGEADVLQLLSASDDACGGEAVTARDGASVCPPNPSEDLTGTRIEATAPVAVFVGHDCARAPFNGAACSHREEQLPPLDTLGPRHVLAVDRGREGAFRVVAAYDDTELRATPTAALPTRRLSAGEWVDLNLTDPVELTSTRPVLVMNVSAGLSFEAPTAQWRGLSEVNAPFGFTTTLELAAPAGATLRVDDNIIQLSPDERLPGLSLWRVDVAPGLHRLTADGAMTVFGVRAHSASRSAAFGVRGGSDLRALPVPD